MPKVFPKICTMSISIKKNYILFEAASNPRPSVIINWGVHFSCHPVVLFSDKSFCFSPKNISFFFHLIKTMECIVIKEYKKEKKVSERVKLKGVPLCFVSVIIIECIKHILKGGKGSRDGTCCLKKKLCFLDYQQFFFCSYPTFLHQLVPKVFNRILKLGSIYPFVQGHDGLL